MTTPKEKAQQLVEKLASPLDVFKININSKRCALIAVDELINMCKLYHNHNVVIDTEIYTELTIEYWKEVKQEIGKI